MTSDRRIDSASRVIDAPVEVVYAALADPTAWELWLPPTGMTGKVDSFDFREGGHYRLTLAYAGGSGAGKTTADEDVSEGIFVEVVPNVRVVQDIAFATDDPAFTGTMRMTWSLEARGHFTQMTITAENVPSGISPDDHAAGFQSTLYNLARFVESAEHP